MKDLSYKICYLNVDNDFENQFIEILNLTAVIVFYKLSNVMCSVVYVHNLKYHKSNDTGDLIIPA